MRSSTRNGAGKGGPCWRTRLRLIATASAARSPLPCHAEIHATPGGASRPFASSHYLERCSWRLERRADLILRHGQRIAATVGGALTALAKARWSRWPIGSTGPRSGSFSETPTPRSSDNGDRHPVRCARGGRHYSAVSTRAGLLVQGSCSRRESNARFTPRLRIPVPDPGLAVAEIHYRGQRGLAYWDGSSRREAPWNLSTPSRLRSGLAHRHHFARRLMNAKCPPFSEKRGRWRSRPSRQGHSVDHHGLRRSLFEQARADLPHCP